MVVVCGGGGGVWCVVCGGGGGVKTTRASARAQANQNGYGGCVPFGCLRFFRIVRL